MEPAHNNEKEFNLLLRALKSPVFCFAIVRHNHRSFIDQVEQALKAAHLDRPTARIRLPLLGGESIGKHVIAQESGYLLVEDFQRLLEDDSARITFNQQRGKLSKYPIGLIVFIPDSVETMQRLLHGLPDFWSIRNLDVLLVWSLTEKQPLLLQKTTDDLEVVSIHEEKLEEIERLVKRLSELEGYEAEVGYQADLANRLGLLYHSVGMEEFAVSSYEKAKKMFLSISDMSGANMIANHISKIYDARRDQ